MRHYKWLPYSDPGAGVFDAAKSSKAVMIPKGAKNICFLIPCWWVHPIEEYTSSHRQFYKSQEDYILNLCSDVKDFSYTDLQSPLFHETYPDKSKAIQEYLIKSYKERFPVVVEDFIQTAPLLSTYLENGRFWDRMYSKHIGSKIDSTVDSYTAWIKGRPGSILNKLQFESWFMQYPNDTMYYHWICEAHAGSIQVFHANGCLLTGTPLYGWDSTIDIEDPFDMGSVWLKPNGSFDMVSITEKQEPIYNTEAWRHCGIWALWVQQLIMQDYIIDSRKDSLFARDIHTISPVDVTKALKTMFPDIIPSTFSFDDSQCNGGSRMEVVKLDDSTMPTFTAYGETIKWTGSISGATGLQSLMSRTTYDNRFGRYYSINKDDALVSTFIDPPVSLPFEILEMDEAHEDLIVVLLGTHGTGFFGWYEDDQPLDPTDDPDPEPELEPELEPEPEPEPELIECSCLRPSLWRIRDNRFEVPEGHVYW